MSREQEYVISLNLSGEPTSVIRNSSEYYLFKSLRACCIIRSSSNPNKVLLQEEKYKWKIISGHIDPGEEPLDTMVRELSEELGIKITKKNLKFERFVEITRKLPNKLIHVFSLYIDSDIELKIPEGSPVTDLLWVNVSDIRKRAEQGERFSENLFEILHAMHELT